MTQSPSTSRPQRQTALVVGAHGVIGSQLIAHLLSLPQWEVIGLSRRGGRLERVRVHADGMISQPRGRTRRLSTWHANSNAHRLGRLTEALRSSWVALSGSVASCAPDTFHAEAAATAGTGPTAGAGALAYKGTHRVTKVTVGADVLDLSMYHIDALVRRAPSLQKTREGRTLAVTY